MQLRLRCQLRLLELLNRPLLSLALLPGDLPCACLQASGTLERPNTNVHHATSFSCSLLLGAGRIGPAVGSDVARLAAVMANLGALTGNGLGKVRLLTRLATLRLLQLLGVLLFLITQTAGTNQEN